MGLLQRFIITMLLSLLTLNVYAGKNRLDPIGWSMTGTIPATVTVNHSYAVNFTLINNLPFTMPTALQISNNSSPLSEATLVDSCSGLKLAPKQTCTVGLVFVPKSAGSKNLSIYMEYGSNKVQIPVSGLSTQATSNINSLIQANVLVGLPSSVVTNVTYPLNFQFINNGTSLLSNVSIGQSGGNSPGYTQTGTTCTSTLAAGASCTVTGTFNTPVTSGDVVNGLTLSSNGGSANATTSAIINNNTNLITRTFTFVNNCSQTVWFGFSSSSVNNNGCASSSDCSYGSQCDPAANGGAGLCFYNNPVPINGVYQLSANGGTNTAIVTDYGLPFVWSGNLAARTGTTCGTGTCDTADCQSNGGNNACPVGQGFAQPATLAELTLLRNSVDSYDVSIINGMNVGVQIQPTTNYSFASQGIAAYNCQSPGNPNAVPALGLGACTWTAFTPPAFPTATSNTSYVYVKPPTTGAVACTANTDCTVGPNTTCGLNFNATTGALSKVCGQFLGYVSADQVCSFAHTNTAPGQTNNPGDAYFNCDTALGGSLSAYSNFALFSCFAQSNGDLNTCYNGPSNPPASTTNCCGCINWQNVGGVVVPSSTTQCVNSNTQWGSLVEPGIQWLKTACPTAYTYPFDDKASGFSCMDISASHTVNSVNYTFTFCPT